MKFFYLILVITTLTIYQSYAQNSFPASGRVGIGTTSPQSALDVQHVGTGNSGAVVSIQGFDAGGGAGGYLRLIKSKGTTVGSWVTTAYGDGFGTVDFMGVNASNEIGLGARIVGRQDGSSGNTYLPGKLSFFAGNASDALVERMTITSSGDVGIGAPAPISDFQVGSASVAFSVGSANSADLHYGTSYIGFNAARGNGNWTITGNSVNNGGGVIYNDVFGNIYMAPIASNGAGIQNLTDLEIKSRIAFSITPTGVVRAKQIKIETANWPDYVFKKDYQLKPLSEVKTYIEQNQHLPEIPSAEQVSKDGLNLGEMNKLLLQKVEELTLYLIEKDKEKKEQEQTNKMLTVQIGELRTRLESLSKIVLEKQL